MAFQLGALGAIQKPELVGFSKAQSGNYRDFFSNAKKKRMDFEDREKLNALGDARSEAILDSQGGSEIIQGLRKKQQEALANKDSAMYDQATNELKSQMQIESAEAKADPFGKNQMLRKRAENVGRRGITGNAKAIMSALQSQNPLVANLTNLERELDTLEQGSPEYNQKYSELQKAITEHDAFAVTNNQLWHQKKSTRNLEEELEENRRSKAEEKRKQGAYANVNFKEFRNNFQKQNKKLVDSADVAKGITPLVKSASKGNTQSVASIVKRMARMASNEAIVMPELLLGFSGSVEDRADAWIEQFAKSGNRIPESELRRVKESYNATSKYYNDVLDDAVTDGIADWKAYSGKAKGMSSSALKRQFFGKDYKSIPLWTDVIKYKSGGSTQNPPPDTSDKRDTGGIVAPDGMTDRERLDAELLKLMQGE